MSIIVNTQEIINTSQYVDRCNRRIADRLSELNSEISVMKRKWTGDAANAAADRYSRINNSFSSNRYNVLNDFSLFLRDFVKEGYEETEVHIKSNAARFH